MTLASVRSQARKQARSSDFDHTDAEVNEYIVEAVREFSMDVNGFPMRERLQIDAHFDTVTFQAVNLTIVGGANALVATDVPITTTKRKDASGTTVASDLQDAIRAAIGAGADLTVTWSKFKFTVTAASATSIVFAAPADTTYQDATLFLGLSGTSATPFVGAFPQDCTIYTDLPSDLIVEDYMEWDQLPIGTQGIRFSLNPRQSGMPVGSYIRGQKLYLSPSPDIQYPLDVFYRGTPDALVFQGYQGCGLSDKELNNATGLSTSTDYDFGVEIDGAASVNYTISVDTDDTFSAVIDLMNAQVTGASFSLIGGDLVCTSDATTGYSAIALSAGTGNTDLFVTLTGFSAFDTAIPGDTDLPDEIPDKYHMCIMHLVASYILRDAWEEARSQVRHKMYERERNQYIMNYMKNHSSQAPRVLAKAPRVQM